MKRIIISVFLFLVIINSAFSFVDKPSRAEKLIIGVKETPPFIIRIDSVYSGICIDLWNDIAVRLGIEYEYKKYENLPSLLSALQNNEVDASINPLTVTADRLHKFDFTQPFFVTNLGIAIKSESEGAFVIFIRNLFSAGFLKIIGLLFLIILIFGFIVWLVERKHNENQFGSGLHGIGDGIWWSAVTMTTVGYGDKAPKTALGRLFSIIWMFTAVIVVSSFTASIASSLTIHGLTSEIKNVEDLRKVDVGTIPESASAAFLDYYRVKYQKIENIETGLRDVYKGNIKAFVYDEAIMTYMIKSLRLEQEMSIIPSPYSKEYFSFASPNSELISKIDPVLISIIESQRWKQILDEYNLEEH